MVSAVERVVGPTIPKQPEVKIFDILNSNMFIYFFTCREMQFRVSASCVPERCLVLVKFLPTLTSAILRANSVPFARSDFRQSREHKITLVFTFLRVT